MLRILFAFALLVFSISLFAQSKGDEYYQEAKTHLETDIDKAIKGFINAQAAYLKDKNYYRYFVATQALSIVYQDTGDGVNAEKIIKQAQSIIPQTSEAEFEIHAKLYDNLAYTYMYVTNKLEDAMAAYNESVRCYEKAGKANTPDIAFELVNRAVTYYNLSKYQEAVVDLEKAISIYANDKETTPASLAGNYLTLGTTYSAINDFPNALKAYNSGLSLLKSPDDDELIASFHNGIGNVQFLKHEFTPAVASFKKAKGINEALFGKGSTQYVENVINEGNALEDMGDWNSALQNYQEVLTLYQQTPPEDLNIVIDLFLNISRITDDLGMPDKSALIYEQALKLATDFIGKNSLAEASVYEAMAANAFNHGAFDQSLNYNFKALSIFGLSNESAKLDLAIINGNIGQAYDELNDLDIALKYKQQSIDLYTALYGQSHPSTAMAIGNLGHTFELKNDYNTALQHLNTSLSLLQNALPADDEKIGITYLDIGLMHAKKNEISKAIENLEKARLIFDGYSKNLNKAKIYNRLALAYGMKGDFKSAEKFVQGAIIANTYNFNDGNFDRYPDKPDFLNYYEMVSSFIAKADLYTKRGDKENLLKGLKHLEVADQILKNKAVDLINPKDRLELAQLNSFFTEAGLLLTSKLFEVTNDQQYVEKAFYYSERSKANELLSEIKINRASSLSKVPKALLTESATVSNRLNSLRQQIAAAHLAQSQSLITQLKAEETDLAKSYLEIKNKILNASPSLNLVASQRAIPTWSEIKKQLDAKTVLVSYTITDSAKFIFIGNSTKLVLKRIPPKSDIDKWMRGYTNLVKFQSAAISNITDALTDLLWNPVEEVLPAFGTIEMIVIVPDGALHLLPFESLGKEKFLIEKYNISYRPAAAFLMNKPEAKKAKPSFVAMAPVFADRETNYVNKSCQRFVEFAKKTDSTSRAFSLKGDYISPLPATKVEVEKIHSIHQQKGNLTKFFLQEAAREELIKGGELAKYDYVHLATHGFVNSQYPELSGLLLTQDAKSSEDGILYSGEILGLNIKADLVTLSACETALGKKIEGEGVRGLTTAFLFAGAKTVVASLWKVADESTSLLMIEFYNQLLAGKDKSTALQLAKLSLIKDEKYRHPYYWAPFVQIGEN